MPINIFLQHFEYIYGKDYLNTLNAVNTITLIRPNTTNTLDSKFNTTHKIFLYSPLINNETINVVINEDQMSKIHPYLDGVTDIQNNTQKQEYKLEFSTSIKSCTVKLNNNKTISDSINKYLNLDTISYEIQDIESKYNLNINTNNSIGNFIISSKSGSVCCMIEHDVVSYIKNEFGSGRIYKIITDLEDSFANILPMENGSAKGNWDRPIPYTGNFNSSEYTSSVNGELLLLNKSNHEHYGFKERAKFWKDVSLKAKTVFDKIYTQLVPEEKNEIKAIKDNIYNAELQSKQQDDFYKHTQQLTAKSFEDKFSNVKYLIGAYNAVITKTNSETTFGSWDLKNIKSMRACFANPGNNDINFMIPNTQNVTDMSYMFYGAENLKSGLNYLKTENVRDMSYMFYETKIFDQPINDWNVGNVTNMTYMFYNSKFNQPINDWNVSNVTDMSYMFKSSHFGQNKAINITGLEKWDIGKVINLKKAFSSSYFGKEGFELLKSLKPCNSDVITQIKRDKEDDKDDPWNKTNMINHPDQSTKHSDSTQQILDIVYSTNTQTGNLKIRTVADNISDLNNDHNYLINLIVDIKQNWYKACFNED